MNTDIQVARFSQLIDVAFNNWYGTPVELGGRGGVVQLWAIHHYIAQMTTQHSIALHFTSALSSNPDHEGDLPFGLDELVGSPAIYGTHMQSASMVIDVEGGKFAFHNEAIVPLYGIIRPRRQVWVLYLVGYPWTYRQGIEVYYSEIDASTKQEAQVNYKYGKYRRGR